jgi:hypothetical protein
METLLFLQALTLTFYVLFMKDSSRQVHSHNQPLFHVKISFPFFVYKETSINSSFLLFLTSKEIKEEGYFSSFDNSLNF